jgi:hypothetical protein
VGLPAPCRPANLAKCGWTVNLIFFDPSRKRKDWPGTLSSYSSRTVIPFFYLVISADRIRCGLWIHEELLVAFGCGRLISFDPNPVPNLSRHTSLHIRAGPRDMQVEHAGRACRPRDSMQAEGQIKIYARFVYGLRDRSNRFTGARPGIGHLDCRRLEQRKGWLGGGITSII